MAAIACHDTYHVFIKMKPKRCTTKFHQLLCEAGIDALSGMSHLRIE